MQITDNFAQKPFPEAAELWLASRKNISDREHSTRFMYETYIKSLALFFGNATLDSITSEQLSEYQTTRCEGRIPGRPRKAGASVINHELSTLKQILCRAGLWKRRLGDWYEQLPLGAPKVGCALTPDEERKLFETARSRSRWLVAFCCSLITANTTAGPGEIRKLQLQDINLSARNIHVRLGAKNKGRDRLLPLNPDALWAVTTLYERARKKGCHLPQHYLLPHRAHVRGGEWDLDKPAGGWRTAWEALRVAAGQPTLRSYDLRHHVLTKAMENPDISDATLESLAGHLTPRMKDAYSHPRAEARRRAVESIGTSYAPAAAPKVPESPEPETEAVPRASLSWGGWTGSPSAITAVRPVLVFSRRNAG